MSEQQPSTEMERAKNLLRGYPEGALSSAKSFFETRRTEHLDALVISILTYHLPANPAGKPDVAAMPRSTLLVQDLAFDSLSAVEMSFLLQDLFAVHIPDKDLVTLQTVDDLLKLVRGKVSNS